MAKEFYQLIRSFGGLSLEYALISESDFAGPPGSAYVPPERGDFRRVAGSRQIQLLANAPGVVETFQTSATGDLFLPANTVADNTNDAGDGRIFFIKNSGTQDLYIKDYLGTQLMRMPVDTVVQVIGNEANNWDIYFRASDIFFDNSVLNWPLSVDTIQEAIEHANGVDVLEDNINKVTDAEKINFKSPFIVTNDGNHKATIEIETGFGGDGVMTLGFGNSTGDDEYIKAIGGSQTTDKSAPGFPRPVKIIGYFVDSYAKTDKTFVVHLREKTNLPVNKYSITKPIGGETTYGWDLNGYTTYAAGERITVYVARGTDKADRPKLVLWYVWDD